MSNLKTSQDLLKQALINAGEVDNGNSNLHAKALEYLNESYVSVLSGYSEYALNIGEIYPWATEEDPLRVILNPVIEAGTISLTNGLAAGTFSSAPTDSMKGRYLRAGSDREIYKIKSHTAGASAFILANIYIGATSTTYGFEARKLEYDLGSDVLRLAGAFESFKLNIEDLPYEIYGMDYSLFKQRNPLREIGQRFPSEFCVRHESDDTYLIRFNGYTSNDEIIEIPYIKKPDPLLDSQGSIPLIPLQHRKVLSHMTAAKLLIQSKKDFAAGKVQLNFANKVFESMSKQFSKSKTESGKDWGRLVPRRGAGGGRFVNGRFLRRDLYV